jgi:hypothetical protein
VAAGGPLVENKVRFFGSFRDWRVHQNVPVQNSQIVLDQTNITSGLGNVTYQVNRTTASPASTHGSATANRIGF